MLSRSFGMPSRKDGPPSIWDTHGISGNVFEDPVASSTAPYPQELNPWSWGISEPISLINGGEEWESDTSSSSEMPVRTVSQKFSPLQWRRLFKELWGRPTTTADFRSSFRQIPHTSNVCLLEDKIQDWSMYLFTISYGRYALDQRSGDGWFSGWFKIFLICKRNSNARFLKYSMRGLLQHWTEPSIISLQKREVSLEEQKSPERRTVSFAEDRLPTWCTSTSGSLGSMILSKTTQTRSAWTVSCARSD